LRQRPRGHWRPLSALLPPLPGVLLLAPLLLVWPARHDFPH